MKRLPTIRSVQSRVQYVEPELQRILCKQPGSGWFRKRNTDQSTMIIEGYATFSTVSAAVSLSGVIEIAVSDLEQSVILQMPSFTRFLVTCIEQNDKDSIPAFAVSLS